MGGFEATYVIMNFEHLGFPAKGSCIGMDCAHRKRGIDK